MANTDANKNYRYKDLDLDFLPHPNTGDVTKKYDAEAIKRSVKSLVLTKFYERLFQPDIGTNVSNLLFDLSTPITAGIIKKQISDVIRNYEPRVEVLSINVTADNFGRSYLVNIVFQIVNRPEPISFSFILERTS